MSVAIGLDIGTSSVKGLAVSPEGEVLARAEREYGLSTPQPGWAEQDPEEWWRASEAVLAELGGAGEAAGIGLSGQMHGLVALDDAERVLRPAILWNDQRTGEECREIEATIGLDALIAATGNRALGRMTEPIHRALAMARRPLARPGLRIARSIPEHRRILTAIAAGDAAEARAAMHAHLATVEGYLHEYAESLLEEEAPRRA